jgi:hypothetical protein
VTLLPVFDPFSHAIGMTNCGAALREQSSILVLELFDNVRYSVLVYSVIVYSVYSVIVYSVYSVIVYSVYSVLVYSVYSVLVYSVYSVIVYSVYSVIVYSHWYERGTIQSLSWLQLVMKRPTVRWRGVLHRPD